MLLYIMSSKTLKTRRRILKASWKILLNRRGKAVRMSDIAKAAKISRQALYLHFESRTDLLIATTLYIDEVKDIDGRLKQSREATSGLERLNAFIDAWGNYMPEIYGVAKALLALRDTDDAAAQAWDHRMTALRHGCHAAVTALANDNILSKNFSHDHAIDILWMMLAIRNWEQLTQQCGWSQQDYITNIKKQAHALLLK